MSSILYIATQFHRRLSDILFAFHFYKFNENLQQIVSLTVGFELRTNFQFNSNKNKILRHASQSKQTQLKRVQSIPEILNNAKRLLVDSILLIAHELILPLAHLLCVWLVIQF